MAEVAARLALEMAGGSGGGGGGAGGGGGGADGAALLRGGGARLSVDGACSSAATCGAAALPRLRSALSLEPMGR